MDISIFIFKRIFVISFAFLFLLSCKSFDLIHYGNQGMDVHRYELDGKLERGSIDFKSLDKIELKGFSIKDFQHFKVKFFTRIYETTSKKTITRILHRGDIYLPMIKKVFKENGIPEDLAYLPIIESGFNTKAISPAGAAGLWQFMPATARYYGMERSYYHDDRMDPLRATKAAAYHLKILYKQFNDWLLVLSAYNAGSGKIRRAIKKYKSTDFWEIAKGRYLKKETKEYVPKFIAAVLIAKNREKYNISTEKKTYRNIKNTQVEDSTSVSLMAEIAGMKKSDFLIYNPSILGFATPAGRKYMINLPENKIELFISNLAKIPRSKRITYRRHLVKIGENLTKIAIYYDIPINVIAKLNKLKSKNELFASRNLLIPISLEKGKQIDKRHKSSRDFNKEYTYEFLHETDREDTLYLIAKKYNVDISSILAWNNLKNAKYIRPGMILLIKK